MQCAKNGFTIHKMISFKDFLLNLAHEIFLLAKAIATPEGKTYTIPFFHAPSFYKAKTCSGEMRPISFLYQKQTKYKIYQRKMNQMKRHL